MKFLVCISNYGDKQLSYLDVVLQEYLKFNGSFDISVVLFSTQNNDAIIKKYPTLNIVEKMYDAKIGVGLPHMHKEYMSKQVDNYDLFMYTENDIRISAKNVERFMELSDTCKNTQYIPGFVRFEICKGKDLISLVDCHPRGSRWGGGNRRTDVIKEKVTINNSNFFVPFNSHHGGYILTKDQYKEVLESSGYFRTTGYAGPLETAATSVYAFCGLKKAICYDTLEDCMIHHLPNKYCAASFSLETVKRIYLEKK
jgi:hypothetical protein